MYLFVILFFFKQKTAYELRISDWSSDVCSSDLTSELAAACAGKSARRPQQAQSRVRTARRLRFSESCAAATDRTSAPNTKLSWTDCLARWAEVQIGRASCRERVCQYV